MDWRKFNRPIKPPPRKRRRKRCPETRTYRELFEVAIQEYPRSNVVATVVNNYCNRRIGRSLCQLDARTAETCSLCIEEAVEITRKKCTHSNKVGFFARVLQGCRTNTGKVVLL